LLPAAGFTHERGADCAGNQIEGYHSAANEYESGGIEPRTISSITPLFLIVRAAFGWPLALVEIVGN